MTELTVCLSVRLSVRPVCYRSFLLKSVSLSPSGFIQSPFQSSSLNACESFLDLTSKDQLLRSSLDVWEPYGLTTRPSLWHFVLFVAALLISDLLYTFTNSKQCSFVRKQERREVGIDRYVFFRADTDTDYYRSSWPITDILNRYTCLV